MQTEQYKKMKILFPGFFVSVPLQSKTFVFKFTKIANLSRAGKQYCLGFQCSHNRLVEVFHYNNGKPEQPESQTTMGSELKNNKC